MPRPKTKTPEQLRQASRDAQAKWRKNHPDKYKAKYLADNNWNRYGLSQEEWLQLRARGCGICGSMDNLVIDHNHETAKVRGVLCTMHNTALGKFNDDPAMLRRAIQWLENPPCR